MPDSNIVVIVFKDMDEAEKVHHAIQSVEHEGRISLDDSAVIVKDEEGKIHVKNQTDRGVKVGAVGGGLLGLLIGGLIFPGVGLLLGVLGGAAIGKMAGLGVDKKFITEVSEAIEPGNSALFVVAHGGDPNVALAALRPYKGELYHTSLDPETQEELRRILSDRIE